MPLMNLFFSPKEVAEILAAYVAEKHGAKVDPDEIQFDIEPAYHSRDPREHREQAKLTRVVVPAA